VLNVVAGSVPLDDLRQRIAELPPFMRPAAVAQVAALPRDAAGGKIQRRAAHRAARPELERTRMTRVMAEILPG